MTKAKIVAGSVISGLALLPTLAFAQYSTTTAASNANTFVTDVGSTFGSVITVILGIMGGLLALGWAIRKIRRHVTGKSF